jgi:hypothetical protein
MAIDLWYCGDDDERPGETEDVFDIDFAYIVVSSLTRYDCFMAGVYIDDRMVDIQTFESLTRDQAHDAAVEVLRRHLTGHQRMILDAALSGSRLAESDFR